MRARFVFEKFTADSDPIYDMGIGMESKVKDYVDKINKERSWGKLKLSDTREILSLLFHDKNEQLIKYLLKTRDLTEVKRKEDKYDSLLKKGDKMGIRIRNNRYSDTRRI